jgi:hypothetical protein
LPLGRGRTEATIEVAGRMCQGDRLPRHAGRATTARHHSLCLAAGRAACRNGGEERIRTSGPVLPDQPLSRRLPSATRPPLRASSGGGSRIRTHGALRLSGFQDRRLKPLGHPSKPSGTTSYVDPTSSAGTGFGTDRPNLRTSSATCRSLKRPYRCVVTMVECPRMS